MATEQEHFDALADATGDVYWGNRTAAGRVRLMRKAADVKALLAGFADPAVLEIGCGAGAFSEPLLAGMPALRLTGCDISPRAVEAAAKRCRAYAMAQFHVIDVNALNYPPATYDAVIGTAILHHLHAREVLERCFAVLKPGGAVWFSEPNMMNPQIALEKNCKFIGRLLDNSPDETAFFRWRVSRWLRGIGFIAVDVRPWEFLHPATPAGLIKPCVLAERLGEVLPLVREVAGNLRIVARKPGNDR